MLFLAGCFLALILLYHIMVKPKMFPRHLFQTTEGRERKRKVAVETAKSTFYDAQFHRALSFKVEFMD